MKDWINFLCLFLIIGFSVYLLRREYVLNSKNLSKLDNQYKDKIKIRDQYYFGQVRDVDMPINATSKMYNLANKSFSINNFYNKLVFCVPEGVCNICYETFFEEFTNYSKIVGINNIIVLVPKSRLREMIVEIGPDKQELHKQIYGIDADDMGVELFRKPLPFLFVLDKDLRLKNLHIHNLNSPELTEEYIKLIRARFFRVHSMN